MITIPKIIAAALLAAAACPAVAQTNGSNSPYSRYGYGLLSDGGNAFNKGMAGTAYGMRNGTQLNTKNPASYSAIDSLTFLFDFGMSLQNGNISQNGIKTNAKNTSVDYISAGFRLAKGFGMSAGLVPFSTIGYNTYSENKLEVGNSTVTRNSTFSGDGGLHEAYVGLGWAPFKSLSVGVNAGYLWGDLTHNVMMSFSDVNINSSRLAYETDVRTYKLDFGVQYEQQLGKNNKLTLGLTYGLGHDVNRTAYYYNQKVVSNAISTGDTLKCDNAYQLPHTFGVGLTWAHKQSLRVGVDYSFEKWGDVKFPMLVDGPQGKPQYVVTPGNFMDRHKVSLGLEFVQNPESYRWHQRIRYTAGFSYATPYTRISGVDGPQSFLASAGVALPIINMHNNRSFVNFAVQYERVKPKHAGMLTENYLRFSIGLTFNERWFVKWKAQ